MRGRPHGRLERRARVGRGQGTGERERPKLRPRAANWSAPCTKEAQAWRLTPGRRGTSEACSQNGRNCEMQLRCGIAHAAWRGAPAKPSKCGHAPRGTGSRLGRRGRRGPSGPSGDSVRVVRVPWLGVGGHVALALAFDIGIDAIDTAVPLW